MSDSTRQTVLFPDLLDRRLEVRFDAPNTTSDGGALLLKAIDERLGLSAALAEAIGDQRDGARVKHTIEDLIRQRVFGLACGYEDANDVARVGEDPVHRLLVDRDPLDGERLASQSSLSRFENRPGARQLMRAADALLDVLLRRHRRRHRKARLITIDLDPMEDPAHGKQQGVLFNGFYRSYCYLPVFAFLTFDEEPEQYLAAAMLRNGLAHCTTGSLWLIRRLVERLSKAFPKARLRVRLDGGFAAPQTFELLEELGVEYLVGMPKNSVLLSAAEAERVSARASFERDGELECYFGETRYAAGSWNGTERRVIFKAEIVVYEGRSPRENTRYVVTNLRHRPERVYALYRQRGEVENRLKELSCGLGIDRTSCHRFSANQFRVLLTSAAFVLLQELRRRLTACGFGRPQVDQLRLQLIKIGGRVHRSVRRYVLHLARAHPWQRLWRCAAFGCGGIST